MSQIQKAQQYLEDSVKDIFAKHGVPALAAVLVRDGGAIKIFTAQGIRKADVLKSMPENHVQLHDKFNLGSISKPLNGYLVSYMVQEKNGTKLDNDDQRRIHGIQICIVQEALCYS